MTRNAIPIEGFVRDAEPRFSLNEIPVPMVYATHRIIRDCNDAFAELFGYERADLIDKSFRPLPENLRFHPYWKGVAGTLARQPQLLRRAHHDVGDRAALLVPGERQELPA